MLHCSEEEQIIDEFSKEDWGVTMLKSSTAALCLLIVLESAVHRGACLPAGVQRFGKSPSLCFHFCSTSQISIHSTAECLSGFFFWGTGVRHKSESVKWGENWLTTTSGGRNMDQLWLFPQFFFYSHPPYSDCVSGALLYSYKQELLQWCSEAEIWYCFLFKWSLSVCVWAVCLVFSCNHL